MTAQAAGSGGHGRLARHTLWSLAGAVLPLAVGLATIPLLSDALGLARFGLLGLAWALLEYAASVDGGLGRATAHAIARASRAGASAFPAAAVAAALAAQAALGVVVGLGVALAAAPLATSVLGVPGPLEREAVATFRLVGATVPFALLTVSLRAALEAAERFDAAAALRLPVSLATFVVPTVLAAAGAGLAEILAALLVVRVVAVAAGIGLAARFVPGWRLAAPAGWRELRPLAGYGAWATVSVVLAPVFLLLDRFVLGAVHGVDAVGRYLPPFEVAVRLLVLPGAVGAALFARASVAHARDGVGAMRALFDAAALPLTLVFGAVVAGGVVAAPALLDAWLGAQASDVALALRLLLVGVAANALAHVPVSLLYAAGHPRDVARAHVAELALHVPLTLLLVARFGVAGAAAAWTLRALLDAAAMFVLARRRFGVTPASVLAGRWPRFALSLALLSAAAAAAQRWSPRDAAAIASAAALAALLFAVTTVAFVLRPEDRRAAVAFLRARPARTAR